jgi:hypothetical protein
MPDSFLCWRTPVSVGSISEHKAPLQVDRPVASLTKTKGRAPDAHVDQLEKERRREIKRLKISEGSQERLEQKIDEEATELQTLVRQAPDKRRHAKIGKARAFERNKKTKETWNSLESWSFTHVVGLNRAPFLYGESAPTVLVVDSRVDKGYWEAPIRDVDEKHIRAGLLSCLTDLKRRFKPDLNLDRFWRDVRHLAIEKDPDATQLQEDDDDSSSRRHPPPAASVYLDRVAVAHQMASAAAAAAVPPPPPRPIVCYLVVFICRSSSYDCFCVLIQQLPKEQERKKNASEPSISPRPDSPTNNRAIASFVINHHLAAADVTVNDKTLTEDEIHHIDRDLAKVERVAEAAWSALRHSRPVSATTTQILTPSSQDAAASASIVRRDGAMHLTPPLSLPNDVMFARSGSTQDLFKK